MRVSHMNSVEARIVMPPVNTIIVQTMLLPPERRSEEALGQAQRLLTRSLAPVEQALDGREYLSGPFTAADIMLGHAIFMSNRLGCVTDEMPNLKGYVQRVAARPAFETAIQLDSALGNAWLSADRWS